MDVERRIEKGFCTKSKKEGERLKRYIKRMAKWIRSESHLSVEIQAEGQKETEITRSKQVYLYGTVQTQGHFSVLNNHRKRNNSI